MSENLGSFRIPPQAIEVEKHVIGGLLMDPESMDTVSGILGNADFYLEKNKLIYRAIESLHIARVTPDLITIRDEMQRAGTFEEIGGDGYLMEIMQEVASSANIGKHAEIVKDKATLRQIIHMATRILESAYSGDHEAPKVIKQAEEGVYRLAEAARGAMEGLLDMQACVMRAAKQFDAIAKGTPMRTRLGVAAIDDVMHGLRNGSLNILAARPGIGKSALALQAAVACGQPVPLFSLEMLIEEEIERMMAHLDPNLNSNGVATQAQVLAKNQAIHAALEKLAKYPIEICDSSSVTVPFVLSECRRMKRKHGKLGMIMVDYLQMMEATGSFGRRDLEVGSLSGGLKKIGNELATPVLAVASLSRKCEERDNKRPVESDLRDAGQIESDAHGIIFLYRESKYSLKAKKDDRVKNLTECSIPKNRGGDTGRTLLDFNGAMSWFYPVSQDDHAYYLNFLRGGNFMGEAKTGVDHEAKPSFKPKGRTKGGTPASDWGKQTSMEEEA